MDISLNDLVNQCFKAIQDRIRNLRNFNIVVTGKTGVGKSTLINSMFHGNMADTGIGEPVTKEIQKHSKPGCPLVIYDTPGFELTKGQTENVKRDILKLIETGVESRDVNQMIHCIWYCVSVTGDRTFDGGELEWIKDLTSSTAKTKVPVIVVLTKAYDMDDAKVMKNQINAYNLPIAKVVPVVAQDKSFNGGAYIVRACNLEILLQVTSQCIPEELLDTLQHVQKVSLSEKKNRAHAAVATAAAAAVATGASPIPFSDAALLIPTQVTMIASITAIFGIEINKGILTALVSSTLGSAGATVLGKTAVSNILKLIPGVGTVAGAVISGSTAGVITTALGEAYILLMEKMFLGEISAQDLEGERGRQIISEAFKQGLKKR